LVGCQRECDDRLPTQTRLLLCDGNQLVFHWPPTLVHLAARYFFCWSIHEAKLAHSQLLLGVANRRAKGSALYGPESV
jgi:hypothetical protein